MGLGVSTGYNGNTATTALQREGVQIGPAPDFWNDINTLTRRLRPVSSAQQQAQALRSYEPAPAPTPAFSSPAPAPAKPQYDDEPIFGTLTYPYGSAGFYQPYQPGQSNLGTGQQPVAMGFKRTRIG